MAIVEDGRVAAAETFPHGLQHAAKILPVIDSLCRSRGFQPRDIDELYVSAGPGSFTGLRIGITLAKTMALATGVKVVAVPTVRVLAENAPAEAKHLLIVLDAKRDQIFTARFERADAGWQQREPARLTSLAEALASTPRPVDLLGEGVPFHRKFIPEDDAGVRVTPEESWRARAEAVAAVGWKLAREGAFADPLALTPIYIRRPEAEEKFEAARGAESTAKN